jgi:NADH-quinone oxidoreductase subunit K
MAPLTWYLVVSALLFGAGLYTVLARRHAVGVLMGVELMLNAGNLNLVAFARYLPLEAVTAQAFALFVIAVAAAEAAVGLGLVIAAYRTRGTVNPEELRILRG